MRALLLSMSRRLLLLAFDSAVRRALPEIYKRLDRRLPELIATSASPDTVRLVIGTTIASVTKCRATAEQIAAVIGLYDPTLAARK